jgi:spore maturation protein CgeB
MKVMFLPLNYGMIIQKGVCDAFRNAGCQLEVFDYMNMKIRGVNVRNIRQNLIERVGKFQPHLLHMQIQHTDVIDAGTIQNIKKRWPKIKITNINVDIRNYVQPQFKAIGRFSDYNLIPSTGQLHMYRKVLGDSVHYWQIGYDPLLYYPPKRPLENFAYDAMFIGNYTVRESYPGTKAREKLCLLMNKHFRNRFALHGGGWPRKFKAKGSLNQRKLVNAYHKSFCSISVNHFNDTPHYFSDRLLMCLACGRPTISLRFPKWETYFTNNCDLVIANSVDEIPKKVKFLLRNRELAEYIGKSGAEKAFAEHTYLSRINELLQLVGLKE